jgi:hypothetical protein
MSTVAIMVVSLLTAQVIAVVFCIAMTKAAARDDELAQLEGRLVREGKLGSPRRHSDLQSKPRSRTLPSPN